MEFIAINLDDFHGNQKDAGTTAKMVFIEAENINKAKGFLERNCPESPWAVVCKQVFDANIVTRKKAIDREPKASLGLMEVQR